MDTKFNGSKVHYSTINVEKNVPSKITLLTFAKHYKIKHALLETHEERKYLQQTDLPCLS